MRNKLINIKMKTMYSSNWILTECALIQNISKCISHDNTRGKQQLITWLNTLRRHLWKSDLPLLVSRASASTCTSRLWWNVKYALFTSTFSTVFHNHAGSTSCGSCKLTSSCMNSNLSLSLSSQLGYTKCKNALILTVRCSLAECAKDHDVSLLKKNMLLVADS